MKTNLVLAMVFAICVPVSFVAALYLARYAVISMGWGDVPIGEGWWLLGIVLLGPPAVFTSIAIFFFVQSMRQLRSTRVG
jgi:hypothetical protein